jgi:hypothetical protein
VTTATLPANFWPLLLLLCFVPFLFCVCPPDLSLYLAARWFVNTTGVQL